MSNSNGRSFTRREAIGLMGAMAFSGRALLGADQPAKPAKAGIALQLYTLRDPAKKNLAETLKKTRDMGWEYVQWSGMPDLPAEKIREALDAAGLKAIAAHCGVEPFEKDFDNNVKFWKTVGALNVGPGGMMGDCKSSLEAWKKGAKRLDAVGAKLRGVGMRLSYHNHAGEFEKFPGDPRCKLDILYEETNPENLFAEFDTAWVQVGGADPAAYIRKYKNRCPWIHVKDLAPGQLLGMARFRALGKGCLKWDDIFAAGREAGIEWYIYEQDNFEGDPFDCAKISFEFLKRNLG
ncbi:MAG TPA: sugar phosphate isomerase/epimerase [Candidatus Brocadiia bacterium]|nr:sugar phosphate isomerase/epimerase [Candidatus Brocadiia bacterium]